MDVNWQEFRMGDVLIMMYFYHYKASPWWNILLYHVKFPWIRSSNVIHPILQNVHSKVFFLLVLISHHTRMLYVYWNWFGIVIILLTAQKYKAKFTDQFSDNNYIFTLLFQWIVFQYITLTILKSCLF